MSANQEPTRNVFRSGQRGIRHTGVRKANEKTVLTVVAFNSGSSNAEISRLSGLAPQTVSAILASLERDGLVTRGPVLRGRRGQPATPILLNPDGGFAIGVEIGWRHLDVVLINLHTQVLEHYHAGHDYPDAHSIFDTIASMIERFTGSLTAAQRARLLDIGIAMPGSLTTDLDLLGAPDNQVALWRTLDPVTELRKRTTLDVTLINDGNAGCWSELIALDPPRSANVIFLMVSQLLLAGVVSDGVLWEGLSGHAADLGSTLVCVGTGGPLLAHQVASLFALRRRLAEAGYAQAQGAVEDWDLDAIAADLEAWINEAALALAQVIHNTSMLLELPLVVLDTELGPAVTAQLVARLETEMARLPTRGFRTPRVIGGKLGRMAPAIGAAEMPLYRRYF